jgi:hypothetical protein
MLGTNHEQLINLQKPGCLELTSGKRRGNWKRESILYEGLRGTIMALGEAENRHLPNEMLLCKCSLNEMKSSVGLHVQPI